ncbi:hypothetical protein Q9966_005036 [Columba livia]|nr:hypothetical protein Q9966_005036 [Columba livia]
MGVCSDNKVRISHDQGQTQTRALLTKVQTEPKERDLCNILCTPLFQIDSNAVPSLEDLDRYKWHLALLTAKKEKRHKEFLAAKQQILLLMEELGHDPESSFELDVVYESEEPFCLLADNITALQTLLQQVRGHMEPALRGCCCIPEEDYMETLLELHDTEVQMKNYYETQRSV